MPRNNSGDRYKKWTFYQRPPRFKKKRLARLSTLSLKLKFCNVLFSNVSEYIFTKMQHFKSLCYAVVISHC